MSALRRIPNNSRMRPAEASAQRRYERHFVSKLTDADGEQQETQHWIETAADCEYLTLLITDNFCKSHE